MIYTIKNDKTEVKINSLGAEVRSVIYNGKQRAWQNETGVQVMELLKRVAEKRLVVMVTHNPELAESYATRIVKLRDGKITDDSNPFEIPENIPFAGRLCRNIPGRPIRCTGEDGCAGSPDAPWMRRDS